MIGLEDRIMDDLAGRIQTFMLEIRNEILIGQWMPSVISAGYDERVASKWAAELGHVVEEFDSTLRQLARVLTETDAERIPVRLKSFSEGVTEVTVPEIVEPMERLLELVTPFLPPETDYDAEVDSADEQD